MLPQLQPISTHAGHICAIFAESFEKNLKIPHEQLDCNASLKYFM
ncbi:protein of unknown function [Xenorhabdus doucetiae]|uniref:Uncharacterized protein n=1 Tax=Xenorhabdus doucetiae TaxID=351671 RepID=A0A068QPX0_9GAMM|nr:protein of unknown function [Xenorhabdus doucetiae]